MFCGCKLEFGAEPNTHTLPGVPGPAGRSARAEQGRHRVHRACRSGHELRHREALRCSTARTTCTPTWPRTSRPRRARWPSACAGIWTLDVDGPAAKERGRHRRPDAGRGVRATSRVTAIPATRRTWASRASTWRRTPARWCTSAAPRAASRAPRTRSWTTTAAGTPLIELVTEPDLRTPEEARLFMQKLRQIYLAIGISDCSMEEGLHALRRQREPASPRHPRSSGVKTELKNMNSLQEPPRRLGLRDLPPGRGAGRGRPDLPGDPPLGPHRPSAPSSCA